jgi:hypothetical protein
MELGTNDVWSHLATATILTAFSILVDQMREQKASMRILVAQITPMNPSGCSDCEAGVEALNKALPAWAAGKSTTTSPITVVDCWTGYNTATDTGDGVHPNDKGNAKLATCWFEPLKVAILAQSGSPNVVATTAQTTASVAGNTGVASVAPIYGQCGGTGWTGATACASGSTCKVSGAYYSQCLP